MTKEQARNKYKYIYSIFSAAGFISPTEFKNLVLKRAGDTTDYLQLVKIAEGISIPCKKCRSTGLYITGSLNGVPQTNGGRCYRCKGKGRMNFEDAKRCEVYDRKYQRWS